MIDNNQRKAFSNGLPLLSLLLSIDIVIDDQIQALCCGLTSTSNNCFCFSNKLPCVMIQEKQT